MRGRRAVVAGLAEPPRQLRELAAQQDPPLRGRRRVARHARRDSIAQDLAGTSATRRRATSTVEGGDLERRQFRAPDRPAIHPDRQAEDAARGRRDRELVQRVEQHVLREVALRQQAQRAVLQRCETQPR